MLEGATETFLKGVSEKEIVCFIDDTFWDTGKNGLALTKTSLRWKAIFDEVLVVNYSSINENGMKLNDDTDTITFGAGDNLTELVCDSAAFAEGMYKYGSSLFCVETGLNPG